MSNKKGPTSGTAADAAGAQEKMNTLYTAHQVHTLAHIVYHHFAGGAPLSPWGMHPGAAFHPLHTVPHTGMAVGASVPLSFAHPAVPGAPPALFYWYP